MESEKRTMAIEWFHSRKLDEIEKLCLQALPSDALDAQAHHLLGFARYRRRDLESAEVAFKEAIRLDPNNACIITILALFCAPWLFTTTSILDSIVPRIMVRPQYAKRCGWVSLC